MVILIGSQKGGCGKSTLAVNLATYLSLDNWDVCLIDADRQGTASRWAQDRNEIDDIKKVPTIAQYDNISQTVREMDARYDFVIVDVAGRDNRELRTGLTAANLLITPFRPSQPDLDTMENLNEIVQAAKDLNPELICRALLTMVPTNPVIKEGEEAREYLAHYPEFKLLTSKVRDRKAYRDSISEGLGVVEWKDSKAKAEIQLLAREVFNYG